MNAHTIDTRLSFLLLLDTRLTTHQAPGPILTTRRGLDYSSLMPSPPYKSAPPTNRRRGWARDQDY